MTRKPITPNRWHQRVISMAREQPVIQTNDEQFETKFTCGAKLLNPDVVAFCIRQGWLTPRGDGLLPGHSQTFTAP